MWPHLEHAGSQTPPGRLQLHLLTLLVDQIPVKLTAAGIDIHLSSPEPSFALPEVSSGPEGSDDEDGKIGLEEIIGSAESHTNWGNSRVELIMSEQIQSNARRELYLSCENDENNEKAEPRAPNAKGSLEWDLIKGVAMVDPSLAETNVGQAD